MKPDFYVTRLDELDAVLKTLSRAQIRDIGVSAGGRPIRGVAYGKKESIDRRAPLAAALDSQKPGLFYGDASRQVVLICAAIHGGEMESIAGVCSLMSILETGKDLRGKAWPGIVEAAKKLRIVIVPSANPDGRARIPKDDPTTWTEEEVHVLRHGRYVDGTPATWPGCKAPLPASDKEFSFLGGYFNDKGVVPDLGYFLGPDLDPEAHALLTLALDEHADCVLDLHSCESGPFMIVGDPFLPKAQQEAEFRLDGALRQKLRERNLGAKPWTVTCDHKHAMNLYDLFSHVAGAQPFLFEGPNGMYPGNLWTHDQIVEMYLTLFEVLLTMGAHERFGVVRRP